MKCKHPPRYCFPRGLLSEIPSTQNAQNSSFVIDIQNALAGEGFPGASPHSARVRSAGTEILKRARKAIDDAEKENHEPPLEMIFVQHEELEDPADPLVRGKEGWKLVFEPEREGERLVSKTDGSRSPSIQAVRY